MCTGWLWQNSASRGLGPAWPVAWLSLDTADNDPARFWRYVIAALDRACPGASSESVHASLRFLLEHRPTGLRLILASRSDPPLELARLRGRGQLTELRAAELRFTADEAAALLQQMAAAAGGALADAAVAALAARTEGWAAGLQLAGLSLRGQHDVGAFVAAFTGSHRYVLDYLAEEVLERQSELVRTFLLETSVLQRLSGPLCDAVTGRAGSQAMLEQVERAGLFRRGTGCDRRGHAGRTGPGRAAQPGPGPAGPATAGSG